MVWSAEMHQQFVEAVERLGVDSAGPARPVAPPVSMRWRQGCSAVHCHSPCVCELEMWRRTT